MITFFEKNNNDKTRTALTWTQSLAIGFFSGTLSSLTSHPFQVMRSRFQNYHALKARNPSANPPAIFIVNPKILFNGFSATLLTMWSLTITQALAKNGCILISGKEHQFEVLAPLLGGVISSFITTPFEGAIIRQNKTLTDGEKIAKGRIFKESMFFYRKHGISRLYSGTAAIGIRTAIVGSSFSFWTPLLAENFERNGLPNVKSIIFSSLISGTLCILLSQPAEAVRIEQQFFCDGNLSLSIRQAKKNLMQEAGFLGLFKGTCYRLPRAIVGIFINSIFSLELENYFRMRPENNNRMI